MRRIWIPTVMIALALAAMLAAPTASAEDDATKGRVAALAKALSLAKIDLATAIETAAKKADGTALFSDFEVEDGVPVFEVLVYVGGDAPKLVEVEVDATNGKVLETEILGQDDEDDDADEDEDEADEDGDEDDALAGAIKEIGEAVPALKIALAKAVLSAAKEAEGTAFRSRFEMDDGVPTWEVFVLATSGAPRVVDVDVHAATGKVLEMETVAKGLDDDDADDEDDDEEDDDDGDDD